MYIYIYVCTESEKTTLTKCGMHHMDKDVFHDYAQCWYSELIKYLNHLTETGQQPLQNDFYSLSTRKFIFFETF